MLCVQELAMLCYTESSSSSNSLRTPMNKGFFRTFSASPLKNASNQRGPEAQVQYGGQDGRDLLASGRKTSSEVLMAPNTAPPLLNTLILKSGKPYNFFFNSQQPAMSTSVSMEQVVAAKRPFSMTLPESFDVIEGCSSTGPAFPPPCIEIPKNNASGGEFSKRMSATLPQMGRCPSPALTHCGTADQLKDLLSRSSPSSAHCSSEPPGLRGSSCPTSATHSLSLVNRISGTDLSHLLRLPHTDSRKPIVLDTRKADAYHSCHIKDARMANCTTRVMMKRTCAGLQQLLSCPEGQHHTNVIVYNDTGNLQGVASSASGTGPPGGTPVCLLLSFVEKLSEMGHEVFLLDGGVTAFRRRHSDLCEFNTQTQSCLYSPTNPDSESSAQDIYNTGTSAILPFLFIGNEHDAGSLDQLRELGITGVINVTSHVKCHHRENGVEYCRLPATDCNSQDMRKYFDQAFKFIDDFRQKGHRVLVHCHAGVSRSATIVIAYIMKHSFLSMHDAYTFVKERRSIISPNFNFLGQLHLFEEELQLGKVKREVICDLFGSPTPIERKSDHEKNAGIQDQPMDLSLPPLKKRLECEKN